MTAQPPYAHLDGEDPGGDQVVVALDEYRRAMRAVTSAAPAASVRARAERRVARNWAMTAVAVAAAVVAVVAGGVTLSDRGSELEPSQVGQQPAASASAASAPCHSEALFPRLGRPTISATEATSSIELINTGAPCTVSGYVGLQLRADNGAPITTAVQYKPGATATITIATAGSAVAPIAWTWSDGSGIPCQTLREVAVTVPGDTAAVTAPWAAGEAGSVCDGVVKVYPLTR
jgi:hypothetical protein